jgi:histidine kinase
VRARLPVRLLGSYLVVLAIGVAASWLTVRLLTPRLFERRMGQVAGRHLGEGGPGGQADVAQALLGSLDSALGIGALIAALAAGAVAAFVTHRLLTPLDAVRATTRQIAAGRYDARVEVPSEPELAALAEDVNTLAAALGETEARRLRLLGEVAHEMRTPLTAVEGYVEGMIDGVFTADEATLGAVGTELGRLRRLAEDLSALSRTEEGRTELRIVPTDLTDLVRRSCERLEPQFADAGVRLTVQPGPPAPVRADPDRIGQVLVNLLGNAIVASPHGSVSVRVETRGDTAVAEVSATGVGLAHEDLERVFERFYRVPAADRRRSDGSGIGLTIARGLARAHGGDLTAASAGPGAGSTFRLTLPLTR